MPSPITWPPCSSTPTGECVVRGPTAVSQATDVDPIAGSLGRKIRTARDAHALSMRGLAARSGLSQPFLSAVERGLSMPSIATLYRIADALDVSPASLLPQLRPGEVHVVRGDEGSWVPSSERTNSAVGRLVFSDDGAGLEVYEYRALRSEDLDVWFAHDGEKVLYVITGELAVEFDVHPTAHLRPGDCIVHPGQLRHRWTVEVDPLHLLLVIVRRVTPPR